MATETKLAVILHADVAGSSALVQRDERLAHDRMQEAFRRFSEAIRRLQGVPLEIRGDALVAQFSRASDAATAALEFQGENEERHHMLPDGVCPTLRVGIALGEVVVADNTVTGSGVVLARRLEELAEPGGICISAAIREAMPGRLGLRYEDLGERELKGFEFPQRAYRIRRQASEGHDSTDSSSFPGAIGDLDREIVGIGTAGHKLSIVVLPFVNLSGGADQEFFVDGLTESLTTEMSRMSGCLVIARNTAFAYKGKPVPVTQIGAELGVRYVLEGSVQAAGRRVRVNAQLIDADSGTHTWAERFDSAQDDILDMQDEIVSRLARTLSVELTAAEAGRVERLRSQHPDSTNLALRGWARLDRGQDPAAWHAALELFKEAVGLDPDNADAQAGLSVAHSFLGLNWATDQRGEHLREAESSALRALALAPNSARSHFAFGRVLIATDRCDQGIGEFKRALGLDPNLAQVHGWIAMGLRFAGRPEETEEYALNALRLSPRDVWINAWYFQIGAAALQLGQFDKAVVWLRRSLEAHRNFAPGHFFLASALAHRGEASEAATSVTDGLTIDPGFTIRRMREGAPSKSLGLVAGWGIILEGMKKAGVPE